MDKRTDNPEKLNGNDLEKVAGGFEIAKPLPEFIRLDLKPEEKLSDHMDKDFEEEIDPS